MTQLINKYNTFLKYGIVAGLSFAFDLFLFTLFTYFFSKIIGDYAIITGTICARIISSFVNYLLNKNQVFKTEDGKTLDSKTLIQYYTLTIIQMCVYSSNFVGFFCTAISNSFLILKSNF